MRFRRRGRAGRRFGGRRFGRPGRRRFTARRGRGRGLMPMRIGVRM